MLTRAVVAVAVFGVAFVGSGAGWRYVCPRFVDVPADDDLALLAVREGVAVGLVAVGVGVGLTALGTLELLGVGTASGSGEPLVVLATLLPVREVGGVVMVVGVGLVVASLLFASGRRAWRRHRG